MACPARPGEMTARGSAFADIYVRMDLPVVDEQIVDHVPAEERQKSVWIAEPRLAGGSNTRLARSTPCALYFLKVYELDRGPLGGSPRATAPTLGPRPG